MPFYRSTMVKRGEKGDATVLKPSIMFCVPLILDRVYKVGKHLTARTTLYLLPREWPTRSGGRVRSWAPSSTSSSSTRLIASRGRSQLLSWTSEWALKFSEEVPPCDGQAGVQEHQGSAGRPGEGNFVRRSATLTFHSRVPQSCSGSWPAAGVNNGDDFDSIFFPPGVRFDRDLRLWLNHPLWGDECWHCWTSSAIGRWLCVSFSLSFCLWLCLSLILCDFNIVRPTLGAYEACQLGGGKLQVYLSPLTVIICKPTFCIHILLTLWRWIPFIISSLPPNRVTDKPHPRGEVYIGGGNIAAGYFLLLIIIIQILIIIVAVISANRVAAHLLQPWSWNWCPTISWYPTTSWCPTTSWSPPTQGTTSSRKRLQRSSSQTDRAGGLFRYFPSPHNHYQQQQDCILIIIRIRNCKSSL